LNRLKTASQVTRLENGVTLATAEMPHMASASLGIWVGVGGRCEPARLCGASHFIEHMLFKGTRRRNARQISQDVEGIGGYLNAFTTEELTCFHAKASHERLPEIWDVLGDMFLNSVFDPGEIEKERKVIQEELAMYLDQPHHHVQELLNGLLWPDHPLGRPLTGTPETLAALSRADLLGYLRDNYVTQGTLITIAGRVRHAEAVKLITPLACRFRPAAPRPFEPVNGAQQQPRVHLHTKETEQTQIALGIRTCSRHDERRFALRLLNVMLGENMSSRLFQSVREDHGLAYSISSSLGYFADAGALIVSAGVETGKIDRALKLIIAELAGFARRAPSAAELRRARDYVLGQFDLSLENTENQMTWLGEQHLGYGKITSPAQAKNRLKKVTASEIGAAARDFFRPDRLSLALVSPRKNARGLAPMLTRLGV